MLSKYSLLFISPGLNNQSFLAPVDSVKGMVTNFVFNKDNYKDNIDDLIWKKIKFNE